MQRLSWLLLLLLLPSILFAGEPELYFGALQPELKHADVGQKIGLQTAVIGISWNRFEPEKGKVNEQYVSEIGSKIRQFRALGFKLQLDLGLQYPPEWIFRSPNARYKNQFGDEYRTEESGRGVGNYVFNQGLRENIEEYLTLVFAKLGADWEWVRLGGCEFGEVNFPRQAFNGRSNSYWAFDDIAQGKAPGLALGLKPCPVTGWIPGGPSPDHRSAAQFLEWYLGSLKNYHDWQIRTLRKCYPGEICMLYGSWGIRPGWAKAATEGDLSGLTIPEKNGEIQAGYDWERMISGIQDPKVIVYCTWIDSPEEFGDDLSLDETRWSPVHWQSALAKRNKNQLKVWGENTGSGEIKQMRLSFKRMKAYDLMGIIWAFESQLFADPNPSKWATFQDFADNIKNSRN